MNNAPEFVVVPEATTRATLAPVPASANVPVPTNDEWTSCRDVLDPASGKTLSNVKLG